MVKLAGQEGTEEAKAVRGTVMVDEHNNALIIHAIKEDIITLIDAEYR